MMRRAVRLLVALVVIGILILAAIGLTLHLGGARWAVNRALRAINPYAGTTLAVDGVGGSLIRTVVLRDLVLRTGSGDVMARVERVHLRYSLASLLSDEIVIDEVTVARAAVRLRQQPDGSWKLPKNAVPTSGSKRGGSRRVLVRKLLISGAGGRAEFRSDSGTASLGVEGLELRARDLRIADGIEFTLDTISLGLHPPPPFPESVAIAGSGSFRGRRITVTRLGFSSDSSAIALHGTAQVLGGGVRGLRDIDMAVDAPRLSLRDLRGMHGQLDRAGEVALRLRAVGSAERVTYRGDLRLDGGGGSLELEGAVPLPGAGPATYSVRARARGLDVARLMGRAESLPPVDAEVAADLQGDRPDRLGGTVSLDLRGPATARLRARLVEGEAEVDATGEAKASRLSLRGKVRPFDSVPGYHLRGTWRPPSDFAGGRMSPVQLRIDGRGGAANIATTLELAGGAVRADGAVRLGSPVRYSIRRGTVEHLEIPAGSSINARFTLLGAGTEPSTALVDAQVDLLSSTVAARRIDSLRADVTLRGGRLSVRTRGTAEGAGVALEADARPFETTTSFQVRRASLQQLDLQRLFPGLGITDSGERRGVRLARRRAGDVPGRRARLQWTRDTGGHLPSPRLGADPGVAGRPPGGREPREAPE